MPPNTPNRSLSIKKNAENLQQQKMCYPGASDVFSLPREPSLANQISTSVLQIQSIDYRILNFPRFPTHTHIPKTLPTCILSKLE